MEFQAFPSRKESWSRKMRFGLYQRKEDAVHQGTIGAVVSETGTDQYFIHTTGHVIDDDEDSVVAKSGPNDAGIYVEITTPHFRRPCSHIGEAEIC
jgi:hypothetical protein